MDLELSRAQEAIEIARHALKPTADTERGGPELGVFWEKILDGKWAIQRAIDEGREIGLEMPDPWPAWKGTRPW